MCLVSAYVMPTRRTAEKKLKRKIGQTVKFIHYNIKYFLDLGGHPLQIAEVDKPLRDWERDRRAEHDKLSERVESASTSQDYIP